MHLQKAHIVSTLLLTDQRQHTSSHPPDIEGREVFSIPDRERQQQLPLAARLRLRTALWLLGQRTVDSGASSASELSDPQRRAVDERTAMTILSYGIQRRLL